MSEAQELRVAKLKQQIDDWKSKVKDFEKEYTGNEPDAVYGKYDMVGNMKRNIARLDAYFNELQGKSGAEYIRIKNMMEAYFISLDITGHKLPLNVLQKDPKGAPHS